MIANFFLQFREEALLPDGFLREIDSRNHAIKPSRTQKCRNFNCRKKKVRPYSGVSELTSRRYFRTVGYFSAHFTASKRGRGGFTMQSTVFPRKALVSYWTICVIWHMWSHVVKLDRRKTGTDLLHMNLWMRLFNCILMYVPRSV